MSPTKKRQTMGKITRERELTERRAMKQEKKERKKLAALTENIEGSDEAVDEPETPAGEADSSVEG